MSPLEHSNPSTADPEYSNIVGRQEKDLKIAFMNVLEVLKEEMNKTLAEICESTGSGRK